MEEGNALEIIAFKLDFWQYSQIYQFYLAYFVVTKIKNPERVQITDINSLQRSSINLQLWQFMRIQQRQLFQRVILYFQLSQLLQMIQWKVCQIIVFKVDWFQQLIVSQVDKINFVVLEVEVL